MVKHVFFEMNLSEKSAAIGLKDRLGYCDFRDLWYNSQYRVTHRYCQCRNRVLPTKRCQHFIWDKLIIEFSYTENGIQTGNEFYEYVGFTND